MDRQVATADQPPIRENTRYAVGDQYGGRGRRGFAVPQLKNDNDGRQKADQDTVRRVQGRELVTLVDPGAELTKVSTTEQPRVTTRPARHGSHAGQHSVSRKLSRRTVRMRAAYMRTRCARR
jgi:microcystin-dependent protein